MARVKKKTIMLAEIRRHIRRAIRWYKIDDGMPDSWSTKNYKRAKPSKGMVLTKKERKTYVFYVRSSKALEEIAEKIYNLFNKK